MDIKWKFLRQMGKDLEKQGISMVKAKMRNDTEIVKVRRRERLKNVFDLINEKGRQENESQMSEKYSHLF